MADQDLARQEREHVLRLEHERSRIHQEYLRVGRLAMQEQNVRFHDLLRAWMSQEVGTEFTIVVDQWLPPGTFYEYRKCLTIQLVRLVSSRLCFPTLCYHCSFLYVILDELGGKLALSFVDGSRRLTFTTLAIAEEHRRPSCAAANNLQLRLAMAEKERPGVSPVLPPDSKQPTVEPSPFGSVSRVPLHPTATVLPGQQFPLTGTPSGISIIPAVSDASSNGGLTVRSHPVPKRGSPVPPVSEGSVEHKKLRSGDVQCLTDHLNRESNVWLFSGIVIYRTFNCIYGFGCNALG